MVLLMMQDASLLGVFPYLDNITVGGRTKAEHDKNVSELLKVLRDKNLTLNDSKTVESVESINILGYNVSNGLIKPDPERLRPLLEFPPPTNIASQRRIIGMFAYYAKWVPRFSDKVKPLIGNNTFPISPECLVAFNDLKAELVKASLMTIDESQPFTVESDASDVAVSAVLNQNGRPVAFFSRTLSGSELQYPAVEKEATALIEAVRKWRHFLARNRFTLVTDQRSLAFMLDNKKRTKIKNNKILQWRLDLSSYDFDIKYRPGTENVVPDTLSRAFCFMMGEKTLEDIHTGLCHPGVRRMLHYVRNKNLPFSTEDVKRVCSSCRACAELKPQFYRPAVGSLVKATHPMERLSIDFKGPLPSASRKPYLLTVIDEYSRFPFAFACPDMSATTVIQCLETIFTLCGMANYVHSDRAQTFNSEELKTYLLQKGIAMSKTTPYHSQGNGQCERYNGIIWKAVQLKLHSQKLDTKHWEFLLPEVLHSIRSLLCTATNSTPHEKFFGFVRRSTQGGSLPTWLMSPGPVLLRKFVRANKTDPLVDEVELLDSNPMYAHIRHADGRESSVSVKDLAPCPTEEQNSSNKEAPSGEVEERAHSPTQSTNDDLSPSLAPIGTSQEASLEPLRRSSRVSKPPERYIEKF